LGQCQVVREVWRRVRGQVVDWGAHGETRVESRSCSAVLRSLDPRAKWWDIGPVPGRDKCVEENGEDERTGVEDVVVLVALAHEKVTEEFAKVGVVRLVVETEGASVVKKDPKLVREAVAEQISWSG
jgi:hypothetical protein